MKKIFGREHKCFYCGVEEYCKTVLFFPKDKRIKTYACLSCRELKGNHLPKYLLKLIIKSENYSEERKDYANNSINSLSILCLKNEKVGFDKNIKCCYCEDDLNLSTGIENSHLIPINQGGVNMRPNIKIACKKCYDWRNNRPLNLFFKDVKEQTQQKDLKNDYTKLQLDLMLENIAYWAIHTDRLGNLLKEKKRKIFTNIPRIEGGLNCCYCNRIISVKEITKEHILPKSKSGNNNKENIKPCCKSCNTWRGNMDLPHFFNQVEYCLENNNKKRYSVEELRFMLKNIKEYIHYTDVNMENLTKKI